MSEPNKTFDLATGHLTITHVIMICVAIVGAAIAVAKTYNSVSWRVEAMSLKQNEMATKKQVDDLVPTLQTSANSSAAERVKFYISHGTIECDMSVKNKRKTPCVFVFPLPEP